MECVWEERIISTRGSRFVSFQTGALRTGQGGFKKPVFTVETRLTVAGWAPETAPRHVCHRRPGVWHEGATRGMAARVGPQSGSIRNVLEFALALSPSCGGCVRTPNRSSEGVFSRPGHLLNGQRDRGPERASRVWGKRTAEFRLAGCASAGGGSAGHVASRGGTVCLLDDRVSAA